MSLCRLYDNARRSVSNSYAIGRTFRAMMMTKPSAFIGVGRRQTNASFPPRPHSQMLSETIPLYFVARNNSGFWIVREAAGRIGGIFLFQVSALRFVRKTSAPGGCATMPLRQRLELDVPNRGSKIAAWLSAMAERLGSLIPDHPPAIRTRRTIFAKGSK
jgi:hypothetical protein